MTYANGHTTSYAYDALNRLTQTTDPNSLVTTVTYDGGNRLETVTDWNNGQFDYNYDDANRLTDLSRPNGVTSTIIYDDAGRPTDLIHQSATEILASYQHQLDRVGNRRVITETLLSPQTIPAGTFLESDGQVVLEAEHFGERVGSPDHDWLLQTSLPSYTGTSYLQALPDIDIPLVVPTEAITTAPAAGYPIQFTTPGTYTVWTRTNAPNAAGDSLYVGLDGSFGSTQDKQLVGVTGAEPGQWDWTNERLPCQSRPAVSTP